MDNINVVDKKIEIIKGNLIRNFFHTILRLREMTIMVYFLLYLL